MSATVRGTAAPCDAEVPSTDDAARQPCVWCTFRLDSLFLGVSVSHVQEVIRHQPSTRVPKVSPVIAGLMNLRGVIVTTLDLRRRFDLAPFPQDHEPMHVVVKTDDGIVALLVDEIEDVIETEIELFEPPPATLRGALRECARGVIKLDDRLMIVVDTDRLLDLSTSADHH